MLRTLSRRATALRTTAAARASPRCLASIDASADSTRLHRGGRGFAGRGFATVDDAKTTERKTLDLSSHQLFGALGLQTFSKDELRAAFDKATSGPVEAEATPNAIEATLPSRIFTRLARRRRDPVQPDEVLQVRPGLDEALAVVRADALVAVG